MSGETLFVGQIVMCHYEQWTGPFRITKIQKRWFDEEEECAMDGYKSREPKKSKKYHYCPLITMVNAKGNEQELDASWVSDMKTWKKAATKNIRMIEKKAKELEE